MSKLEQNELKTDAKIDMLHHAGFFGSPGEPLHVSDRSGSDPETSLVGEHLAVGSSVDIHGF